MATNIGTATLFFTGDLRQLLTKMNSIEGMAKGAGQKAGNAFGAQIGLSLSNALTGAIGGIGFAALLTQAGRMTLELGKMGEESAQLEARFRAFNGGAQQAAANLKLMADATQGALTNDEQMMALNGMLASGLVDTASQASKVAEAALWLGDASKTGAERIDTLTAALLSGRERALVPYGIDVDLLRQRVDELKAGNAGLSDSQATLNAFMEQAGGLITRVKEEGGFAVTTFQELRVAVDDAKDALGALVAPHVIPLVDELANRIRTNLIPNLEYIFKIRPANDAYAAAFEQYAEAQSKVENAQKWLNTAIANGDATQIAAAQAALKQAEALRDLRAEQYSGAQAAAGDAKENTTLAKSFDEVTKSATGAAKAVAAVAMTRTLMGSSLISTNAYGEPEPLGLDAIQSAYDANIQGKIDALLSKLESGGKNANDRIVDAATKAWQDGIGDITSMFDRGVSASIGLRDFRPNKGDPLGPGANGPYEDIFRLQAWATDKSWGNIAEKYGITSDAQASALLGNFQMGAGFWNQDVLKMIDWGKFRDIYQQGQQANIGPEALAGRIAPYLGSDADAGAIAKMIIGGMDKEAGNVQTSGVKTAQTFIAGVSSQQAEVRQLGVDMILWALTEARAEIARNPPVGTGVTSAANSMGILP